MRIHRLQACWRFLEFSLFSRILLLLFEHLKKKLHTFTVKVKHPWFLNHEQQGAILNNNLKFNTFSMYIVFLNIIALWYWCKKFVWTFFLLACLLHKLGEVRNTAIRDVIRLLFHYLLYDQTHFSDTFRNINFLLRTKFTHVFFKNVEIDDK